MTKLKKILFLPILMLFSIITIGLGACLPQGEEDVYYKVCFYNENSELIKSDQIIAGGDYVNLPTLPEKEGYIASWSVSSFRNVSGDITAIATYEKVFVGSFTSDEHSKVYVYKSLTDEKIEANSAYSRNKENGKLANNSSIIFSVMYDDGFMKDEITVKNSNNEDVEYSVINYGNGKEFAQYMISGVNSDLTINITSTESTYKTVNFASNKYVKVYTYSSSNYEKEPIEIDSTFARNGETGEISADGEGQVNIKVVANDGYKVNTVVVNGSYKNVKGEEDTGIKGVYRITKVESDLNISFVVEKVSESYEVSLDKNQSELILSEICASNQTIIYDQVGMYNDYIEIHNPNDYEVNLKGYAISDKPTKLNKFKIEDDFILNPKSYVLIWGDEFKGIDLNEPTLYLGFGIKNGETIYLSKKGVIVDAVSVPENYDKNASLSRISLDGVWANVDPSPKAISNQTKSKAVEYTNSKITFSRPSGFYDEEFSLTLSCDSDCEIYYTTDGTKPTQSSTKYVGPIQIKDASNNENTISMIENISILASGVYYPEYNIEKANVIRAVAINSYGKQSKEFYSTYYVDFQNKVGFGNTYTLSLVIDPDYLFDYNNGIYVNGKVWDDNEVAYKRDVTYWENESPTNYTREGKGWRRQSYAQFFDEDNNLKYEQNLAISIHGAWSTAFNQKSFNIFAMPEVDEKEYIIPGLFGQNESSLMLRAGGYRDVWLTKMRDAFNHSLIEDRSVSTQDSVPCQVFINGEYWGLYNLQERVEESYFASHYGVDEDDIIIFKQKNLVAGDDKYEGEYEKVLEFARTNDLSIDANYEKFCEMVDIQSYIDYISFEVYVANCDSITKNYAIWKTTTTKDKPYYDGRWRWAIYDTDDSTNMVGVGTRSAHTNDSFKTGNWSRNILSANNTHDFFLDVIKNENFKKQFVSTFLDMANTNFEYDNIKDKLQEMAEIYKDAMVVSQHRFSSMSYTQSTFETEVARIDTFFKNRKDIILGFLKTDFELTGEFYELTVDSKNEQYGSFEINTISLKGINTYTGTYISDYKVKVKFTPKDNVSVLGINVNGKLYYNTEFNLELTQDTVIYPVVKS